MFCVERNTHTREKIDTPVAPEGVGRNKWIELDISRTKKNVIQCILMYDKCLHLCKKHSSTLCLPAYDSV